MILILGIFGAIGYFSRDAILVQTASGKDQLTPLGYTLLFLYYIASSFVVIFFNSALVACALKRFRGGDPTVNYGLEEARKRIGKIFIFSVISATVGIILRALERRANFLGKIAIGFIGAAWSIVIYFVVPVLVNEELSTQDSIKRSAIIFKETWGENFIGNTGMSLVFALSFFLFTFADIGLTALIKEGSYLIVGLIVYGIFIVAFSLFTSTISSIYKAALYFFALEKNPPQGFNIAALQTAFIPKKSR